MGSMIRSARWMRWMHLLNLRKNKAKKEKQRSWPLVTGRALMATACIACGTALAQTIAIQPLTSPSSSPPIQEDLQIARHLAALHEGFSAIEYIDAAGVLTIGFGHTDKSVGCGP